MTGVDGRAFVLCTLAIWRVAHFFACEDGPADVVVRLRRRLGASQLGSLLDCFYCLSVWLAIPCACLLCADWITGVVVWLALSGAASIVFKATERARAT